MRNLQEFRDRFKDNDEMPELLKVFKDEEIDFTYDATTVKGVPIIIQLAFPKAHMTLEDADDAMYDLDHAQIADVDALFKAAYSQTNPSE